MIFIHRSQIIPFFCCTVIVTETFSMHDHASISRQLNITRKWKLRFVLFCRKLRRQLIWDDEANSLSENFLPIYFTKNGNVESKCDKPKYQYPCRPNQVWLAHFSRAQNEFMYYLILRQEEKLLWQWHKAKFKLLFLS